MLAANSIAILLAEVAAVALVAVLCRRVRRLVLDRRLSRSLRRAVRRELELGRGVRQTPAASDADLAA